MKYIRNIFVLIRIEQWPKNFIVFSPLFFSQYDFATGFYNLLPLCLVFICSSSLVYIFNDIVDKERDKLNPIKKNRPLVSKAISKKVAIYLLIFLAIIVLISGNFFISKATFSFIIYYLILNFFYNLILKKVYLLDIITVASGYVLRTLSGHKELQIEYSLLLLSGVFLLSLIILMIKRKAEFNSKTYKNSLRFYNNKTTFNSIFYTLNLFTILIYFLFIKNFLTGSMLIISFFPVIATLLRINYFLKGKIIKKNITNVLFSDYVIVGCFASWLFIILLNLIN